MRGPSPSPAPAWLSQPERSRPGVIRTYARLALAIGRPAARLLLHPICLYFFLFGGRARTASRVYLRRILGREPRWSERYRHFHTFSATVLDRLYLIAGEYHRFDIRTFDETLLRDSIGKGAGGFLLGAHVGSFEVIRSLGQNIRGLRVRVVMYKANARKVSSVLDAVNPELACGVIELGTPGSMLEVERALERGEFVGILADRGIRGERTASVTFLGAPARIPLGPFRLAAITRQPIVLMVGLYRGGNRYDIHFERIADLSDVSAADREVAIQGAVRRFAERLEHHCRSEPFNWFNFYDFWG